MVLTKKLNQSFTYSIVLKLLNSLFPIITFPYVANVLLPSGLGSVEFILSIVTISVVIGQFGIPIYGVRKCSSIRNDKDLLSRTVQELFIVNFFFSLLIFFLYSIIVINLNLNFSKLILIILGTNIIINSFNFEWLLQSLELFKFITIRAVMIKTISFICILLFIKTPNDIVNYTVILFLSYFAEALFNLISVSKFVHLFKNMKNYNFSQHFNSLFYFFILNLTILLYLEVDKITLGFLSNESQVGYYVASNKFVKLPYVFITSFSPVLLPRISYYLNNNLEDSAYKLLKNAFSFVLFLAIPASIGLFVISDLIINVFLSVSYTSSIDTMKILSPLVFIITLSNSIAFLLLIPFGNEKKVLLATSLGAILNIVFNFILIPNLLSNGAALSTLFSEIVISLLLVAFSFNLIKKVINFKHLMYVIVISVPIFIISFLIKLLLLSNVSKLLLISSLSIVSVSLFAFFNKSLFKSILGIFKS